MDLINMVDHSFAKADNLESKLTDAVMNIPGMTSVKIKHFLNNLCSYARNIIAGRTKAGG